MLEKHSPSVDQLALNLSLDSEVTADFRQRHSGLVEQISLRLDQALTSQTEHKTAKLKEHFNDDYPSLTEPQREALVQPDTNDLAVLRDTMRQDRIILQATYALDSQRQDNKLAEGESYLPHQQKVLDDILGCLSEGKKEGFVELATATGKSYLISKLTDTFSQAGLRTLILTPTKEIARQTIGETGTKGIGKFASEYTKQHVGKQFGGDHATKDDQIVVSTYQSFNSFAKDKRIGDFDVMLCDEAHRALGPMTAKNITNNYTEAIKLGFTATPTFGVNKDVEQILPERIHSLSLREAVDSSIAAPVQCLLFNTNATIDVVDPYNQEFTSADLKRLINLKSRNEKTVSFARDLIGSGRQGVIACVPGEELAHARLLADRLNTETIIDKTTKQERQIVARAVGSFLPDHEQTKILNEYEAGNIDVLTFVSVLNEGWDSQRASFLLNACPTTSLVKMTQQIGRVIRTKANQEHAIVVDFVDNVVGKQQVTALQALGEEQINQLKVYGERDSNISSAKDRQDSYLRGILSDNLYQQLVVVDGQLVTELTCPGEASKDSLLYYEEMLAKAGLGKAVDSLGIAQKDIDAIQEAEEYLYATQKQTPSSQDIADELLQIKEYEAAINYSDLVKRIKFVRAAGDVALLGRAVEEHSEHPYEPESIYSDPDSLSEALTRREDVQSALNLLEDRQRDMLGLRYGIDRYERSGPNYNMPYSEMADYFNLTGGGVGMAIKKAHEALAESDLREYASPVDMDSAIEKRLTTMVREFQGFNNETLGFQLKLIQHLNFNERAALLENYQHNLLPLVSLYANKLQGTVVQVRRWDAYYHEVDLENVTIERIGNVFRRLHKDFRSLADGYFDAYMKTAPKAIQTTVQLYKTDVRMDRVISHSPKTLTSGFKDQKPQETDLRYLLEALRKSERLNSKVMAAHGRSQANDVTASVPRKSQTALYVGEHALPTVSNLEKFWQLLSFSRIAAQHGYGRNDRLSYGEAQFLLDRYTNT